MSIFVDTCLFATGQLNRIGEYIDRYGDKIAFEILAKFNEDTFGDELENCLLFKDRCRFAFHEPAWMAEHTAPEGTEEYARTSAMLKDTQKYAKLYKSEHLVYHVNNCVVTEETRKDQLETTLRHLEDVRKQFDWCPIYIENVGTTISHNVLFTQEQFTQMAKSENWDVLVDLGHANACGWDLYRLLRDLEGQIRAFHIHNNDGIHDLHARFREGTIDAVKFLGEAKRAVPDAKWILEYIHPEKEGAILREDFEALLELKGE